MRFRLALAAIALIVWPVAADEAKLLKTVPRVLQARAYAPRRCPTACGCSSPVLASAGRLTMRSHMVGPADEELTVTGLSHYLEHLMFKGTDAGLRRHRRLTQAAMAGRTTPARPRT